MRNILRKITIAASIAASALAVTLPTASAEGESYILVSHAPDSDTWWNTIKNGIALAGKQVGANVE